MDFALPAAARSPELDGTTPDVLILSSENPDEDSRPVRLLFSAPGCRVLALRNDARHSFLYELRPHRTFLGELSRDALLTAIRGLGGSEG